MGISVYRVCVTWARRPWRTGARAYVEPSGGDEVVALALIGRRNTSLGAAAERGVCFCVARPCASARKRNGARALATHDGECVLCVARLCDSTAPTGVRGGLGLTGYHAETDESPERCARENNPCVRRIPRQRVTRAPAPEKNLSRTQTFY